MQPQHSKADCLTTVVYTFVSTSNQNRWHHGLSCKMPLRTTNIVFSITSKWKYFANWIWFRHRCSGAHIYFAECMENVGLTHVFEHIIHNVMPWVDDYSGKRSYLTVAWLWCKPPAERIILCYVYFTVNCIHQSNYLRWYLPEVLHSRCGLGMSY